MTLPGPTVLILASGSMTRYRLLAATGLAFDVIPANVDESALKVECLRQGRLPAFIASALATEKAMYVSELHPDHLILAADQILTIGDVMLDKPVGREGLKHHLELLSGQVHHLLNGVVLVRGGEVLWSYADRCEMEMRTLSPAEQASYVADAPDEVMTSVGGYRIEEEGIHLFRRIAADWSSILGLPLIPVLAALRDQGLTWPAVQGTGG